VLAPPRERRGAPPGFRCPRTEPWDPDGTSIGCEAIAHSGCRWPAGSGRRLEPTRRSAPPSSRRKPATPPRQSGLRARPVSQPGRQRRQVA
jgi:hypothetical protein